MYEFELEVWKGLFVHLVQLRNAIDSSKVVEMDHWYIFKILTEWRVDYGTTRYHQIAVFGWGEIWRFSANSSEMKKMAACDYENLLQVRSALTFWWRREHWPISSVQYPSSMGFFLILTIESYLILSLPALTGTPLQNSGYTLNKPLQSSSRPPVFLEQDSRIFKKRHAHYTRLMSCSKSSRNGNEWRQRKLNQTLRRSRSHKPKAPLIKRWPSTWPHISTMHLQTTSTLLESMEQLTLIVQNW